MINKTLAPLLAALVLAAATPASAANKEHQQMMADIRMLQEQAQLLQNMLGALNESLKALNVRLDEQTNANRKAFADQKLLIDNVSSDLRVVRERTDDNSVRVSALSQQLDQLRQMIQQMAARSTTEAPAPEAAAVPAPATGAVPPPATQTPPPAANIGTSPDKLYSLAWANYTSGQYDLAIDGFEAYIRSFPTATDAPRPPPPPRSTTRSPRISVVYRLLPSLSSHWRVWSRPST